jgi:hypothetical protein
VNLDILGIISFIADLTPLILFFIHWKILKQPVFLTLFCWTILSVSSDIVISFSSPEMQQIIVFYSILLEMLFVGFIYFLIVKSKLRKIVIVSLCMVYLTLFIVESIQSTIDGFPYWLASITVVLTLFLSLVVFYDIYKQNQISFIMNNPYVFILFAYIIYVAGNLFLFATTEKFPNIFKNPGLWSIFIIANTFKNIFISIAILRASNLLKSPQTSNGSSIL